MAPSVQSNSSLTIAHSPGGGNPYVDLFYNALAQHGINRFGEFIESKEWLRQNAESLDAVHIHWPEMIIRRNRGASSTVPSRGNASKGNRPPHWARSVARGLRAPTRAIQFVNWLKHAKELGIKVVWTVHNLEPHEGATWSDRYVFRQVAKLCDLIICHDQSTVERGKQIYRTSARWVQMPHGNFKGIYPAPRPVRTVRAELKLKSDRPVLCCVGRLREYKGLDLAIDAVRELNGEVQLLIAGAPHRGFDIDSLSERLAGCRGTLLVSRSLTDQEFSDYIAGSDGVLLPYKRITGSGALLAALTLERGVIASDLPYFRNVLGGDRPCGTLFPVGNRRELVGAIHRFLAVPPEERNADARALAGAFDWHEVVTPVAMALKSTSLTK